MLKVRRAAPADLERIMEIYRGAQEFMIASGNPDQWGRTYPDEELVRSDIGSGICFVIVSKIAAGHSDRVSGVALEGSLDKESVDGAGDEMICGVFVLTEGDEPTYRVIEDGAWLNDEPYVTIHRIAAAEGAHGIVDCAVEFAFSKADNIRIDTHEKNRTMRSRIEKNGFKRCGIIYVRGGARIAYQRSL